MSKGRPRDPDLQEKTRSALIKAAHKLSFTRSYSSISIREIAAEANTQSSMISYYFGSKKGLFEALILQAAIGRKATFSKINKAMLEDKEQAFFILVDKVIDMLISELWLFKLFQHEVMTDKSEIKEFFIEEFADQSSTLLLKIIHEMQSIGLVKQDINEKYFVASFMSLVGYPIATQPLLKDILDIDIDEVASREWKLHVSNILQASLRT